MPIQPSTPPQPKPLETVEFELSEFDTAPASLDGVPPEVDEVHRLVPGYWEARRQPMTASDRALASAATEWMVRLPPALRPRLLAERYPRVVNRIAATWTHPDRWEHTFDELLVDQRGGREGFPREAEVELQCLRRYREQLSIR